MSDSYKELLIKQQTNPLEKVFAILLLIVAGISLLSGILLATGILVGNILMIIMTIAGIIACPVIAYFIYFRKKTVEYEYTYMSKELRIDRIYNQSKRKSIETLDLDKMEILAISTSEALKGFEHREAKVSDYSSRLEDTEELKTYVMYYNGKQKIIVSFNDDMVNAIRSVCASKVKIN